MPRRTRVHLFGPTRVTDRDTTGSTTRVLGKQGRILAMLALHPGHPVSKDRLADAVWDGHPPPSYRQALDSDVCVLRRRTGLGPGRSSALATTPAGYVLDPDRVWVDLAETVELLERARVGRSAEAVAATRAALELASSELLEDEPYAEWAQEARDAWQSAEMEICLLGSRAAIVSGDTGFAVRCGERAFSRAPASEQAGVQLMRSLWWAGRRGEAIRVYLALKETLVDELGEQPGPEAQRLYLTILREGEPTATPSHDGLDQLRLTLELLRDALEQTPGVRTPAHDADLAAAAAAVLAERGRQRPTTRAAAS